MNLSRIIYAGNLYMRTSGEMYFFIPNTGLFGKYAFRPI